MDPSYSRLFKQIRFIPLWVLVLAWLKAKPLPMPETLEFVDVANLSSSVLELFPRGSALRDRIDSVMHRRFVALLKKAGPIE